MRYRFGPFELSTKPLELVRAGEIVALQPQPARALELFVQRAGELVSREDLREHLWGLDAVLEHEQAINFTVRKVRQALGDEATRPRFVETLPRQGYRFVATVECLDAVDASGAAVPVGPAGDGPEHAGSLRPGSSHGGRAGLGLATVLALVTTLGVVLLVVGGLVGWPEWPGAKGEVRSAELTPIQLDTLWQAHALLDVGGHDEVLEARELLESLLVEAPDSAAVALGLADAWAAWGAVDVPGVPESPPYADWLPEVARWAERARGLDPSLVEAHLHVARAQFYWHRDMAQTERLLADEVLARAPNHGEALHLHGLFLASRGRFDDGIEAIRRALELAPEDLYLQSDLGWVLLLAGRNEESARVLRRVAVRSPRNGGLAWALVDALRRDGHEAAALEAVRDYFRAIERPEPETLEAAFRHVEGYLAGRDAAGAAVLSDRAHFLAALGEVDAALDALERACTERPDYGLPHVVINPAYAILHDAAGYRAVRTCLDTPR